MSSIICEAPSDVIVPRQFIVNLDLPAKTRWQHINRIYVDKLQVVQEKIEKMIEEFVNSTFQALIEAVVSTIASASVKTGLVFYGEELKGLAEDTGISLGRLTLMQFIYESVACCTSIICRDPTTNIPMHIRTMDWSLNFLKDLTINVDFQRQGRTVCKATTWVGYVGILTGMRLNQGYSVAVNFRQTDGSFYQNLKSAMKRGWPIGFLVRNILEETGRYEEAVEQLAQSSLIAPCYFTICGPKQSDTQGTLITRRQESEEKRLTLIKDGPLVQPNMDHWSENIDEDILFSMMRRSIAHRELKNMTTVNEPQLWKLISQGLICNDLTIYGTFMCPEYDVYHTRYPHKRQAFLSRAPIEWIPASQLDHPRPIDRPENDTQTYSCCKCHQKFDLNNNPPGNCVHTGKWHSRYEDCSYVKCGYNLAKKKSIGTSHWSCCYSLEFTTAPCKSSVPHTFIES